MYKLGPVTGTDRAARERVRPRRGAPHVELAAGEGRDRRTSTARISCSRSPTRSLAGTARRCVRRCRSRGAQLEVIVGGGEGRRGTSAHRRHVLARHAAARPRPRARSPTPTIRPSSSMRSTSSDRRARPPRRPARRRDRGRACSTARSGAPLAGVTIDARGPGGATAEATTDDDGPLEARPARDRAPGRSTCELPGYLPFTRELDVPAATRAGHDDRARCPHRSRARRAARRHRARRARPARRRARTSSPSRPTAGDRRGRHRRAGRVPAPRRADRRRRRSRRRKGDAGGSTARHRAAPATKCSASRSRSASALARRCRIRPMSMIIVGAACRSSSKIGRTVDGLPLASRRAAAEAAGPARGCCGGVRLALARERPRSCGHLRLRRGRRISTAAAVASAATDGSSCASADRPSASS